PSQACIRRFPHATARFSDKDGTIGVSAIRIYCNRGRATREDRRRGARSGLVNDETRRGYSVRPKRCPVGGCRIGGQQQRRGERRERGGLPSLPEGVRRGLGGALLSWSDPVR